MSGFIVPRNSWPSDGRKNPLTLPALTAFQSCATKRVASSGVADGGVECAAVDDSFDIELHGESHVVAEEIIGKHILFEGCQPEREDLLRFTHKPIGIKNEFGSFPNAHRDSVTGTSSVRER